MFKILSFLLDKIFLKADLKSILETVGSMLESFGTNLNIRETHISPIQVIIGILGIPKNCVIADDTIGPQE